MRQGLWIILTTILLFLIGLLPNLPEYCFLTPREGNIITGTLFYPLIHASLNHLLGNLFFLIPVLATLIIIEQRNSLLIISLIYIGHGLALWLFGRSGIHIGCSGVALGIGFYVFLACFIGLDSRKMIYGVILGTVFFSIYSTFMDINQGVGDDSHVIGSLTGLVVCALRYLGSSQLFAETFKK